MALGTRSNRWDEFRDWIWRWTHPRAARTCAHERQFYHAALVEVLRENDVWMVIAQKPDATPEELRRLVNQWCTRWQTRSYHARFSRSRSDEWELNEAKSCPRLQQAICAHPNLPLDVFNQVFEVNQHTVTGMLSNPACPLWLLEKPDFFDTLPSYGLYGFARHALRHPELPSSVLRPLMNVIEP
jgi:hypothetical protein